MDTTTILEKYEVKNTLPPFVYTRELTILERLHLPKEHLSQYLEASKAAKKAARLKEEQEEREEDERLRIKAAEHEEKQRQKVLAVAEQKGIKLVDPTEELQKKARADVSHNNAVIAECKKLTNGESIYTMLKLMHTELLTQDQVKEIADAFTITPQQVRNAIKSTTQQQKVSDFLGRSPRNQYDFVELLFEKLNVTVSFQEMYSLDTPYVYDDIVVTHDMFDTLDAKTRKYVVLSDPKILNAKDMLEDVIEHASNLGLAFKDKELAHAVTSWTRKKKNLLTARITVAIDYDAHIDAEPEWDRFVKSITDDNLDEVKAVLKHFMWQVKRKMFGHAVKYHMMPILHGKQGGGKSTIAKDLVTPILDFCSWTDFSSISDNRDHSIWANFVLVFDEMGNSTTSNLEIIKQRLTSDKFTSRVMNTNGNSTIINKTTSIGTTNKDLTRLIFDESGMRRFFQISCKDKLDWAVTQTVDYEMLWRSIDENKETPLLDSEELFNKIQHIQNQKRFITLIEQFLLDRKYVVNGGVERVHAGLLFNEFQIFEKTQTPKPDMTNTKFGRDLPDIAKQVHGLSITKHKVSAGYEYKIVMDPNV